MLTLLCRPSSRVCSWPLASWNPSLRSSLACWAPSDDHCCQAQRPSCYRNSRAIFDMSQQSSLLYIRFATNSSSPQRLMRAVEPILSLMLVSSTFPEIEAAQLFAQIHEYRSADCSGTYRVSDFLPSGECVNRINCDPSMASCNYRHHSQQIYCKPLSPAVASPIPIPTDIDISATAQRE
jgi:hypothetical protein